MNTKLFLLISCIALNQMSLGQNLITNGDFSTTGGWTASPDFYFGTTYSNCPCGTPPCYGYAYLSTASGSPGNNLAGVLYQVITIPQTYSSATFSFCYNATSTENTAGNDDFYVKFSIVGNPSVYINEPWINIIGNVAGTTITYTITDPAFLASGVQITVLFSAGTNSTLATTLRIDDVSFIGCAAPTAPTGLTVQATNCNTVDLSWNAVSGSGITYEVYKNNTSCGAGFGSSGLGPTANTSGMVNTTPGTAYYFVVVATNSCGTSSYSNCVTTTTLTVPATPGSIGGPTSNICQGGTPYYSISPVTGATSYTWTVPSNWTISSGQGSTGISTTAGSSSGQITVTANNICGSSSQQTQNVSVIPAPTAPVIAASPNPICAGQTSILTVTNPCTGCTYYWSDGGNGTTHNVSTNGSYYAWASNSSCPGNPLYTSANSNTVFVNVVYISVSASQSNPATQGNCNGSATATITGGNSPYSYQWSNGQTTSTATGLCGNTTYNVSVTDANNCTASDTVTISEITGTNEPYHSSQISIFPNSTSDSFTIGMESITAENIEMKIYNILGETICTTTLEKAHGKISKEINLGNSAKGIYFVQVKTGEKTYHSKLIIE